MKSEFDKRAYDAAHQRDLYEQFKLRREALYELFGNQCYLCRQGKRKHFHLHHREYHPTESNYPRNSSSMNVRRKRLAEAEAHPERFALLCPSCHQMVTLLQHSSIDADRLKELIT